MPKSFLFAPPKTSPQRKWITTSSISIPGIKGGWSTGTDGWVRFISGNDPIIVTAIFCISSMMPSIMKSMREGQPRNSWDVGSWPWYGHGSVTSGVGWNEDTQGKILSIRISSLFTHWNFQSTLAAAATSLIVYTEVTQLPSPRPDVFLRFSQSMVIFTSGREGKTITSWLLMFRGLAASEIIDMSCIIEYKLFSLRDTPLPHGKNMSLWSGRFKTSCPSPSPWISG